MEILFHGVATKTNGTPVKVGEKLPAFAVKDAADTVKTGTQLFTKVSLISVVPDIDTRVCSLSTKRFNQEVDKYNNINFYTISTNTLEQQKDWCAAEGVAKLELLSDATAEFGKAMGLYVEEKGSMHVASGSLILKVQFSIKNYWQNNQMNQIMLKL